MLSTVNLKSRIHRLGAKYRSVPPERCRPGTTKIVDDHSELDLAAASRCPHCRQPHVLVVEEVIVEPIPSWKEEP